MTYNTTIYTIFIFCLCALVLKRTKLGFALASLIAFISNLPLIQSLSITQWLDTLCGNPSLFLALLCIGSLFSLPKNPLAHHLLPSFSFLTLSTRSKLFVLIFGFVLFWGNINYLWGLDLYHLEFSTQILITSLLTLIAYFIQPYLGFLYLFCLVGYFFKGGNVFVYMMDSLVWLYALLSLLISSLKMLGKNRAK